TKRAPFHRTFDDAGGGHTCRGATTNRVSPWNGKQELSRTAGFSVRAVASSHSSRFPSRAIADVTAEYSASLWKIRSTRSRSPESGPMRHGPVGRRRMSKPAGIESARELFGERRIVDHGLYLSEVRAR